MESSADLFKKSMEKAYTGPGIKLNTDTMKDATKYIQSFKESDDDEDIDEKRYLDLLDMIPMLKKQLMKGTKVDQEQKKERVKSKKETKEATGSGSSGAYSAPMFSGEEPDLNKVETKETSKGRISPIGFSDEYIKKSNSEKKGIKPKNEDVNEDLKRWFKEKWFDVS